MCDSVVIGLEIVISTCCTGSELCLTADQIMIFI
jgi:hypothetical protein